MTTLSHISSDEIRSRFSHALSAMYRQEVPQYGTLLDLVAEINETTLRSNPELWKQFVENGELDRLEVERHGAIRLGTPQELATMCRIYAVMGMEPVGYYDLSVAGVPVHSTAFRPVQEASLSCNPFRVFTSLLRLELIPNEALRLEAESILTRRNIFTPRALELTSKFEQHGSLTSEEADVFVAEVSETFRWHSEATVSVDTYRKLQKAHRLIADVVCFKGPHINHLTPRTLDIDLVQAAMTKRGIIAKEIIEGPPPRKNPILLRQTSFKALEEPVAFFADQTSVNTISGTHTARFGEIEQRGMALTYKGRELYDSLLMQVRTINGSNAAKQDYNDRLVEVFKAFPDELETLRSLGLAFFRYTPTDNGLAAAGSGIDTVALDRLIADGYVKAEPLIYEDFLPVSAAGIFQSNLGEDEQKSYNSNAAKAAFEEALGRCVLDEIALYHATEWRSIETTRALLRGEIENAK